MLKSNFFYRLLIIGYVMLPTAGVAVTEIKTRDGASIADSKSTITGVDRIVINVRDLESMLAFYQRATGFDIIERNNVFDSNVLDSLHQQRDVSYQSAVLAAPNTKLELVEYLHIDNSSLPIAQMPVQGPGMTHTCYQSPAEDPGYNKFVDAGLDLLTRGNKPVDIGGYGVTYAYGYDPEGNMLELEQLDKTFLTKRNYDSSWSVQDHPLWLSQVALVTHNLSALSEFYASVLGFEPYRSGDYSGNEKLDTITDIDGLALAAVWFKLDGPSKVLEIWQYKNPKTPELKRELMPDSIGYQFSLAVTDIDAEYSRLRGLGVDFFSKPQTLGDSKIVYARDIDGNIFSLRQSVTDQKP